MCVHYVVCVYACYCRYTLARCTHTQTHTKWQWHTDLLFVWDECRMTQCACIITTLVAESPKDQSKSESVGQVTTGLVTDDPGKLPARVPITFPVGNSLCHWGSLAQAGSGRTLHVQIFTSLGDRSLRLNEDERYLTQTEGKLRILYRHRSGWQSLCPCSFTIRFVPPAPPPPPPHLKWSCFSMKSNQRVLLWLNLWKCIHKEYQTKNLGGGRGSKEINPIL